MIKVDERMIGSTGEATAILIGPLSKRPLMWLEVIFAFGLIQDIFQIHHSPLKFWMGILIFLPLLFITSIVILLPSFLELDAKTLTMYWVKTRRMERKTVIDWLGIYELRLVTTGFWYKSVWVKYELKVRF
jgi:hypothetical protein